MTKAPIVLAVDTPELATAIEWVKATQDHISVFKLGLEFFLSFSSDGVKAIQAVTDSEIFLDLKLHDIPHTVSGAAQAVAHLSPRFLTVHASGGSKMISAASSTLPNVEITAVTILTSLDQEQMLAMGLCENFENLTLSLAKNAVNSGARAIVSSPQEVSLLRKHLGEKVTLITPGVRPSGAERDDQERIMTPRQAIDAGADFVVIGRPITKASDPKQAAEAITASLR